jgi:hypothetical protein
MALLLTTADATARDEERAEALLREVRRGAGGATGAEPELARFLLAFIAEPEQARAPGAATAARRTDSLAREVDALRRALAAERARRGELEQQVRALKELEQNINERPNGLD